LHKATTALKARILCTYDEVDSGGLTNIGTDFCVRRWFSDALRGGGDRSERGSQGFPYSRITVHFIRFETESKPRSRADAGTLRCTSPLKSA